MFVASVIYLVDESAGGNIRGGFGLLSAACAEASARFPVPDDAGGALVEAAMGNVKEAIVRLEACMSSTFFAAHMCDLLILMGKMADIPATEIGCEDSDIGMSEFYLREYARELELYPGCWRLAADYYMSCDTQATSLLVSFLKRVQYQGVGDPVAEKVLLLCEEKRLEKTARKIREKLGNECAELNNLGGAMAWYAGAGLQKRAQGIADEALRGAEREGVDSEGARRLSYVVSAVNNYAEETMRQVFDYMKVYHDMQEALSSMFALKEEDSPEQFDRFATDFIDSARSLVGSGGLPRRYWCVVVYDAANVLQLIPVVANHFSRTAILDLLGAMQLASGPHSSGELLEGLRARIAYDARAGENAMTDQDALSTVEVAQGVLTHCRTVFVRASATRINAA